ncbi:MAG: hypothetical protein HY739_11015 [Desulfobacterales bacterium]|nr:hypothetical protein [Desulfobacterales bacterium]
MTKSNLSEQYEKFEKLGEQEVRERLATGRYGDSFSPDYKPAFLWLSMLDKQREEAREARREARESENLAISRKALRISYKAIIIAIMAIVLQIIITWFTKN